MKKSEKMKRYSLIIIIVLAVFFTACEEFLSEPPSKTTSVVPSTTEHLENLLNNYNDYAREGNASAIFGTDDYGLLKELFNDNPGIYQITIAHYATWNTEGVEQDDRSFWPAEWKKIFSANLVLSYLDRVEGSEAEKQNLKAEAHFIRAYSYFNLASTYCLPYTDANKGELGLPLKASTSFEESIERATLEETWDMILFDLETAFELDRDLELNNGKYRTWRASEAAVNAFAARVYLTLNDYAKALSYAEAALGAHSEMIDYNTDMRFSDIVSEVAGPDTLVRIWYPYTHDAQTDQTDRMEWKELYYYRFLNCMWWNYVPSPDLLSLYDTAYDLRYKYHIVEDYSYDRGMAVSYPGYIFFFKDQIPSGPTVAEMLLTAAECQARTGNWQDAMNTVNELRVKRMDNTAPAEVINLSASSEAEALTLILEERRREHPYTRRLEDIRRFNNNTDPSDDVVVTRDFYFVGPYAVDPTQPTIHTLEKNSRLFATPLPLTDLISSSGQLEQNSY